MRALEWTLFQYDWCPHKMRKLGQRGIYKGDDAKTQGGDNHLQAKERDLEKNPSSQVSEETNPADTLIFTSGLQNQNCEGINFC